MQKLWLSRLRGLEGCGAALGGVAPGVTAFLSPLNPSTSVLTTLPTHQ